MLGLEQGVIQGFYALVRENQVLVLHHVALGTEVKVEEVLLDDLGLQYQLFFSVCHDILFQN